MEVSSALSDARAFVLSEARRAERTEGTFTRCGKEACSYEAMASHALWKGFGERGITAAKVGERSGRFFAREHSISFKTAAGKRVVNRVDYVARFRTASVPAAIELKALTKKGGPKKAIRAIAYDVRKLETLVRRGVVACGVVAIFALGLSADDFAERVICGGQGYDVSFDVIAGGLRVAVIEVDRVNG